MYWRMKESGSTETVVYHGTESSANGESVSATWICPLIPDLHVIWINLHLYASSLQNIINAQCDNKPLKVKNEAKYN